MNLATGTIVGGAGTLPVMTACAAEIIPSAIILLGGWETRRLPFASRIIRICIGAASPFVGIAAFKAGIYTVRVGFKNSLRLEHKTK